MQTLDQLKDKVNSIDGHDYGACQSLRNVYHYPDFTLHIEQIPKDPYAPPHTGFYRITAANTFTDIFDQIFRSRYSEIACRDFLARSFYTISNTLAGKKTGTGNSGLITIAEPGQAILERNSCLIGKEYIEIRCFIGLPAKGRKIDSQKCCDLLFTKLPSIVKQSLLAKNVDCTKLISAIETIEDAEAIRAQLVSANLAAFIAEGSLLPRKSGTSDRPLCKSNIELFSSPPSLCVSIKTPHSGTVRGMGIPRGVTLLTGGGYHGKTTLLKAIEMGIYNHIKGDGREQCISNKNTVKIRSYTGRPVTNVNITPFINNLPFDKDTASFTTENASGSTSQAASIIESIEAGAEVLAMDEDSCATNFMIRDKKMQRLVCNKDEPITPFIDRVHSVYTENGVSTILALGGVGDYFEVADTIIQMKNYKPIDVTKRAKQIYKSSKEKRLTTTINEHIHSFHRTIIKGSINPYNSYKKKSVYAAEQYRIHFGKTIIDLSDAEQLTELSQTKSLAEALLYLDTYIDNDTKLTELITKVLNDTTEHGLDILSAKKVGYLVSFRKIDLAIAINRLRTLITK